MNNTRNEEWLKKFGNNLKSIRESKNLSLRKLADLAEVDFSQIHRIEKGESNPTITMVLALSEALNIKPSALTDV